MMTIRALLKTAHLPVATLVLVPQEAVVGGPTGSGGVGTIPPPPTTPSQNNGFGTGGISRIKHEMDARRSLTAGERDSFTRTLEILEENAARERDSRAQQLDSKAKLESTVSQLVDDVHHLNLDSEGRTIINRLLGVLAAQITLPHTAPDFITQVRAPCHASQL
jgi:hypothetical protein